MSIVPSGVKDDERTEVNSMLKILVVDDNVSVLRTLSTLLNQIIDFRVVGQASSGDEALTLCQRYNPDVVLLDFQMPVRDGISTSAAILQSYPATKIIIMTSSVSPGLRDLALQGERVPL
jgi:CheY-like chemotaxis protein